MKVLVLAIGIGIVSGLRTFTAPALVSWAAHLGWPNLQGTPLVFMGSTPAAAILTLAALFEYVADKLPKIQARTAPPSLIIRVISGGLCGACICLSAGRSMLVGVLLGAIGALIGTFGGYQLRKRLVSTLKVKDIFVAIPEDLVAIGLAYVFVSQQ
jgi:uncharacterized membrane protein